MGSPAPRLTRTNRLEGLVGTSAITPSYAASRSRLDELLVDTGCCHACSVCVCVCVCARARARMCVRVRARTCERVHVLWQWWWPMPCSTCMFMCGGRGAG